jgi:putative transposase
MKLNISISEIITKIILKNKNISKFYSHKYPNSKYKLTDIINEIIYVLKTGISWRNLRSSINYNTLYWHFIRFSSNNIFRDAFYYLRNEYSSKTKPNVLIIDSTFIQNKFGKNLISRNKFFKNKQCNKLSVVTDNFGIPLSVLLDAGNIHDLHFVLKHTKDLNKIKHKFSPVTLLADKGYVSKELKTELNKDGINIMTPAKTNMKPQLNFDKNLYKKRIIIEHTNRKIKMFRRIDSRWDSDKNNLMSFIYLAVSILIMRKLY